MSRSVIHHYVPQWYQKRFLLPGKTDFKVLDLNPFVTGANGKKYQTKLVFKKGPKKLFKVNDLYTLKFGRIKSDEIERFLFGPLDTKGQMVIDAIINSNYDLFIPNFRYFLEYINAQKYRTPKGLDLIQENIRYKDKEMILNVLNEIRTDQCAMLGESSIEIVSAKKSNVKFLLSDSPVTVYNKKCFPGSKYCKYPNDPSISLIGSQTIFPSDLEHCFIFTNKQFARRPNKINPIDTRINARYFGDTVIDLTKIIRGRFLSDIEVSSINYLIKMRANKYIASCSEDDLYPEDSLAKTKWDLHVSVTLPSREEVSRWGEDVEIMGIGKDEKLLWHQDEYGRTSKTKKEWEEKQSEVIKMKNKFEAIIKKSKEQGKSKG